MASRAFFGNDARRRIRGGAKILRDAVKVAYSPRSGNALISKSYGSPDVTHDGVKIAESIVILDVDDHTLGYRAGAELIKDAAKKLNKLAGDGTTTVTELTYSILDGAITEIERGHNLMDVRRGIEQAGDQVIERLDRMSEQIEGKSKRVEEVATISAGDPHIGKVIAEVISKIGKEGVVTVEASDDGTTKPEIVEGYTFDRGYVSQLFVNDSAKQVASYDYPAVIITDQKIGLLEEILPVLEKILKSGKKEIVLIADDVEGEALSKLVRNKLSGALNVVAVKAPAFGDRRKETLEDIAILTGGKVISKASGLLFASVPEDVIGSARKIVVSKDETTIVEGGGQKKLLKERIAFIKSQSDNATSTYDKEKYDVRAAALSGKVAVIKVGGVTETEINERKDRIDDAVFATKAALAEGIVAGGGVTLVNLGDGVNYHINHYSIREIIRGWFSKHLRNDRKRDNSVQIGRKILKESLYKPFLLIMENTGLDSTQLLKDVRRSQKPGMGIDVKNPDAGIVDMKAIGVIDPVRVTKEAIRTAVSIAAAAATMGTLVVDIPEPRPTGALNE
jgi:chaperonin GroEL